MPETEKISIIKIGLTEKGIKLLETIMQTAQKCETTEGMFSTLNNRFQSIRQSNENAEDWMDRLRIATLECNYKDLDRQLKEQFIH